MRFLLANRIKKVIALKLLYHWLADSHPLPRFQVMRFVLANIGPDCYSPTRFEEMRFVLANGIKPLVAFKLLAHWVAGSYLLARLQVMRFVLANIGLKQ